MKKMFLTVFFLLSAITFTAVGKDKDRSYKTQMMNLTTEERETMAARHEKMAGCLRSGKPMTECREEMMGVEDCPMMGKMHSRGMMDGSEKKRDK